MKINTLSLAVLASTLLYAGALSAQTVRLTNNSAQNVSYALEGPHCQQVAAQSALTGMIGKGDFQDITIHSAKLQAAGCQVVVRGMHDHQQVSYQLSKRTIQQKQQGAPVTKLVLKQAPATSHHLNNIVAQQVDQPTDFVGISVVGKGTGYTYGISNIKMQTIVPYGQSCTTNQSTPIWACVMSGAKGYTNHVVRVSFTYS